MEGKFDEALVEKVAKALHAMGFIIPAPDSAEVADSWDKSPPSYKDMHHIQAKYVLSSLSSTHAIVPKEEYERLRNVLKAAAIARTQGTLRKTCATLSRKDFTRLEFAIADWEVHAGLGYSAKDLEEASPHA